MSRRCEVLSGLQGWQAIARGDLKTGMVFRLFEEDGAPVPDAEAGGPGRWRALADAMMGEDGQPQVEAEAIPESTVERVVRETGLYWPGGEQAGPWAPGRLR